MQGRRTGFLKMFRQTGQRSSDSILEDLVNDVDRRMCGKSEELVDVVRSKALCRRGSVHAVIYMPTPAPTAQVTSTLLCRTDDRMPGYYGEELVYIREIVPGKNVRIISEWISNNKVKKKKNFKGRREVSSELARKREKRLKIVLILMDSFELNEIIYKERDRIERERAESGMMMRLSGKERLGAFGKN